MAPQKGRAVPPETLYEFVVQGTGRLLHYRKVSTLYRSEIRRQILADPDFAEPEPPMAEVDYGDGKVREPNRGHPVYASRMAEWNDRIAREMSKRLVDLVIRRGIAVADAEIDVAAVEAAREDAAAIGLDLADYSDRDVYVRFVCVGTDEDWDELCQAIFTRSGPAEAAVQAHIATFQSDVPGAAAVQSEP